MSALQEPFMPVSVRNDLGKLSAALIEYFRELTKTVNQKGPPGSMVLWNGVDIPDGWLEADGSTVTTELYPELASSLGVSPYTTTFALPNPAIPAGGTMWIIAV